MIGICEDLRKSVLQAAIQGRLTKQLPEDGDAEDLYKAIQAEKQRLIKEGKIKKEKLLPEIKDDEIPFDIPENWKWAYLSDITIKPIKRGKSPHYVTISNTLVFAQKCNTKAGFIDMGLAQYLDESYLKSYPVSEFMNDYDVVINSTGGGTLGRVGIYRDSCNPRKLPIVPDSHVTIIRSMNSTMQQYLYYVLKFIQSDLETMGTGSTNQTELRPDTVKALYIPLPPLAEQMRIVARVDELMKRIDEMEKTEKTITALYDAFPGDMKAALLQAAIQGKLTEQLDSDGNAEDLYREIQAEKQRLIKEGKIKKEKPLAEISEDDIPFDIPENWKWVQLGSVLECYGGLSYKKENLDIKSDSMVTVFRGGNILNNKYVFKGDDVRIAREFVGNSSLFLRKNQLITPAVTSLENLGKVAYIDKSFTDVVAGGFVLNLVPYFDNDIFSKYLHSVLISGYMKEIFLSIVNKSGQAFYNISKPKLLATIIPLPPLAEQKSIVEKLNQLLPICDSMKEAIDATT